MSVAGFHLTHSLGIVSLGAAFLWLGLYLPETFQASRSLQVVAVVVSAAYLVISHAFFSSHPTIGVAVATTCFLAAAAL